MVERWSICNFRHFFQIPGFMPKYGNFEVSPYLGNRCPQSTKKRSISTLWGRKSVHMQIMQIFSIKPLIPEFGNFDNHAIFWKWLPNLKTLWVFHSFTSKIGMQILNLPANFVFEFKVASVLVSGYTLWSDQQPQRQQQQQ